MRRHGAFVARNACRLLWGLEQARTNAHLEPAVFGEVPPEGVPDVLLCDQDLVTRANGIRQDFVPADAGRPKALVLAERLGGAYALSVSAYPAA